MKNINLSDCRWEIKGYWPYIPIKETSLELGQELKGVTDWIPATVPGGVHYDLFRAGWIKDPYYARQSIECEWVEGRWWLYRTSFRISQEDWTKRAELLFEGLDYEADLFLNDERIASHKGMYEPVRIDVTGKLREENKLLLIFRGIPKEMGQIGYTSKTSTQKSRFNYKWDFSTHLVNIGIWKEVHLRLLDADEIRDVYIKSSLDCGKGILSIEGTLQDASGMAKSGEKLTAVCIDSQGSCTAGCEMISQENGLVKGQMIVDKPKLWWPNGQGEPNLYTLQIREGERVLDSKKIGIRTIRLETNEGSYENALPYTFTVNGEKLFVKGINITPQDHLYGNVTKEQYRHLIRLCKNANVNLIRIWGGGLIEKEWLYDACDQAGILIWQEFIQSSSGIDNIPCQDWEFLKLLGDNAKAAILEKRNHASLAVWSGGNELTDENGVPCTYENPNIALLKSLVEQYDPGRFFFPTSASGPREMVSVNEEGHDVHGSWQYAGNPKHYEIYSGANHLFHSEFGTEATPSIRTLKRILPAKDQYPTPMSGNLTWQHHGEWWGTYFRDIELFGETKDLQKFVHMSQFVQAESLRYMIEADRRRKYHCSGTIYWQLNEPWPNSSCTNLVDYYGETKPGYDALRSAYSAAHVSMDYGSLTIEPGTECSFPIYVHLSKTMDRLCPQKWRVTGEALNREGDALYTSSFCGECSFEHAILAGEWMETWNYEGILFLRLRLYLSENCVDENVYSFGYGEHVLEGLKDLQASVSIREQSIREVDDHFEAKLVLLNDGSQVAVHTNVYTQEGFWLIGRRNHVTLFPGEELALTFSVYRMDCGGFLSDYGSEYREELPRLMLEWF